MKICYINYFDPLLIHGGAERVVLREAELVAQSGHEVILITTHNAKRISVAMLKNEKVKVWFLPAFPRDDNKSLVCRSMSLLLSIWNPLLTMHVDRILRMERPDIVHIHNYGPISLSVVNVAKRLGCKVIETFHGYNFECPKGGLFKGSGEVCSNPLPVCKIYKQICKKTLLGCDAIIAVSSYVKGRLVRAGYNPDTIALVPNSFHEVSKTSERGRRSTDKEILFVGRMVKLKGVHLLIEALAKVKKDLNEKLTVNLIGDGEHRPYFQSLAQSYGVNANFLGKVSNRVLDKHYQSAYLVVVPSVFPELFAIVILEAMSHGKPVIASSIGGMPELVLHGQTGFLFEPYDTDALAKYIQILLADEKLALSMGNHALKASQKFSENNHLKLLLNVYDQVLLQQSMQSKLRNPRCKS